MTQTDVRCRIGIQLGDIALLINSTFLFCKALSYFMCHTTPIYQREAKDVPVKEAYLFNPHLWCLRLQNIENLLLKGVILIVHADILVSSPKTGIASLPLAVNSIETPSVSSGAHIMIQFGTIRPAMSSQFKRRLYSTDRGTL
jgi:hypothetical protein